MKSNKITNFLRKNVTFLLVFILVFTITTTLFIGCTDNTSDNPSSSSESVLTPDNSSTGNEDGSSSEDNTEQEETPTTPEDSSQEEQTPQQPTETPNNPPVEEQPTPTPPVEEKEPVKVCFISPVEYTSLGLDYNDSGLVFNQYLKQWVSHKGIDLITESGTQVKSMFNGVVLDIQEESTLGYMVKIDHGENTIITYSSLSSCLVTVGQTVNQNDIIGVVGITHPEEIGYGEHLHLEIVVDNVFVNPTPYIQGTVYREVEQG